MERKKYLKFISELRMVIKRMVGKMEVKEEGL